MLRDPICERLPMGLTLRILLNEQTIEQPNRMVVEDRYELIQLQGIEAVGKPLLVHQLPKLLVRRIALIALKNTEELAELCFFKMLANERGNKILELNFAGLPIRRWPAR